MRGTKVGEVPEDSAKSIQDLLKSGNNAGNIIGESGGGKALRVPELRSPYEGAGNLIDGIKITDGKVGGKIPVDEFKRIRISSIKNPNSDFMTLGKFTNGPDSYIAKAGKDSSYFDMGSEFDEIRKKYGLSASEMFDYFNKPALDDAISSNKTIRFSHDPRLYEKGFLVDEWEYLKSALNLTDSDLVFKGGFWYVGLK